MTNDRIGVFICSCDGQFEADIALESLSEQIALIDGVVTAEVVDEICGQAGVDGVVAAIEQHRIERVVIGGCSPMVNEAIYTSIMTRSGLNPFLLEIANLREQCVWVHASDRERLTAKAEVLLRMAVEKVRRNEPLETSEVPIRRASVLIIGSGVGGLTAAGDLADLGVKSDIVTTSDNLGGRLRRIHYGFGADSISEELDAIIHKVKQNRLIDLYYRSELVALEGSFGNFTATLEDMDGGGGTTVECAAVLIATGGQEVRPVGQYRYGEDPRVMTQYEFEDRLYADELDDVSDVVMIQCIGLGGNNTVWCSRTCCSASVTNALRFDEVNPDAAVHILYQNMMTYGLIEKYYLKAASKGTRYGLYHPDRLPKVVDHEDRLGVLFFDQVLEEEVLIPADLLVLSTATQPYPSRELAEILDVPLDEHGFFEEANMKHRPGSTVRKGVFLVGAAHAPKFAYEVVTEASAFAARIHALLKRGVVAVGGAIAEIDPRQCSSCLTCVRSCVYHAPFINRKGIAEIDAVKCEGCGVCVSECPAKAIVLHHYRDAALRAQTDAVLSDTEVKGL